MRKEEFCEIFGDISEKHIKEAGTHRENKKFSWRKWGAMAACLCLLMIGVLNAGRLVLWRSGCDQTSHNITLADGKMYYIYNNGVYLYEIDNSTQKRLADFNGVLTQTQSGLYLIDKATGEVYSISDSVLTLAGSITPDSILIDVLDDKIYYRTYQNDGDYSVMEKDLTTGTISAVVSVSKGHMIAQKVIGNELYYCTTENGGAIYVIDMQTKDNKMIFNTSVTNEFDMNSVVFFDDFILIKTGEGLFSMGYSDKEVKFLSKYIPTTGALDYFDRKLYFIIAIPIDGDAEYYEEELISLNVQTGEISTVTRLTLENGTTQTYTEIAVCGSGYFYTNPSAAEGGLFYHSFDGGAEITICK